MRGKPKLKLLMLMLISLVMLALMLVCWEQAGGAEWENQQGSEVDIIHAIAKQNRRHSAAEWKESTRLRSGKNPLHRKTKRTMEWR